MELRQSSADPLRFANAYAGGERRHHLGDVTKQRRIERALRTRSDQQSEDTAEVVLRCDEIRSGLVGRSRQSDHPQEMLGAMVPST